MPIQYEGIIAEHMACRNQIGLFDVSHMGELFLEGKDALNNLQRILPNDFADMTIGQVRYSPMLYDNGTCVDDLSVYRVGDEKYMLCVNAANIEKDHQWIQEHLSGDVVLTNTSEQTGQIAIQGPGAVSVVEKLVGRDLSHIKYWWFENDQVEEKPLMLARMGYTGEDGFEIFIDGADTLWLWEKLMELGGDQISPVGLGARDTLRLEVAFPLYGHELDDQHQVACAGLGFFIKPGKPIDFIGKEALLSAREQGLTEKLVRFVLEEKGIPRAEYPLEDLETGETIGHIASGSLSPVTGQGVGMAYVPTKYSEEGMSIGVRVRKRVLKAKVIKGAFIKTARKA